MAASRPTVLLRLSAALLLALQLGGCAAAAIVGGVEGASVAVFGRDVVDIGVSAITGRDCSIVRLDRRQPYCAPREHLPGPLAFCTRTIGSVECWADPVQFVLLPHNVVDQPPTTAEQARQIAARWPKSLNLAD